MQLQFQAVSATALRSKLFQTLKMPHFRSQQLLTIRHQQTWLCSSPRGVQRRIPPLAAGRRSLLSWSPSDSPTGPLTKHTHRRERDGDNPRFTAPVRLD